MSNQLVKAHSNTLPEKVKKSLFELDIPSKLTGSKEIIKDVLLMTPGLVESLKSETKYIADIPAYIQQGINSGKYSILKDSTGALKATVKNVETGKFVKNFNVVQESITPALGPAMLAVGLFLEMKKIEKGIQELNKGIEDVIKNFEHDRYARALAAKEKYSQALLFSDIRTKNDFLIEILSEATTTKHMLYRQITDKIDKLLNNNSLFNNKSKSDLADEILQDFYLFNETFQLQIMCYQELEEYYALSHALHSYKEELSVALTKEVQLSIDGYFSQADNPFSTTINQVVLSINNTDNFLVENKNTIKQVSFNNMEVRDYDDTL